MELRRVRRWRDRSLAVAAIGGAILLSLAPHSSAQPFPFGSELVLDADPMRGSKKIPVLDIGQNGAAEIDLWCNSVKAQLVVAANTITIITGAMSSRLCPPSMSRSAAPSATIATSIAACWMAI